MIEKLEETANYLSRYAEKPIEWGIILGTGLGDLAGEIDVRHRVPYSEIPNFPVSTVEGHSGELVFGYLAGKYQKLYVIQNGFPAPHAILNAKLNVLAASLALHLCRGSIQIDHAVWRLHGKDTSYLNVNSYVHLFQLSDCANSFPGISSKAAERFDKDQMDLPSPAASQDLPIA